MRFSSELDCCLCNGCSGHCLAMQHLTSAEEAYDVRWDQSSDFERLIDCWPIALVERDPESEYRLKHLLEKCDSFSKSVSMASFSRLSCFADYFLLFVLQLFNGQLNCLSSSKTYCIAGGCCLEPWD